MGDSSVAGRSSSSSPQLFEKNVPRRVSKSTGGAKLSGTSLQHGSAAQPAPPWAAGTSAAPPAANQVLWDDDYTEHNPFHFEELSVHLGFPGKSSWGYWPHGGGVDLSRCRDLSLKPLRQLLVQINCPVHDLNKAKDYAMRLHTVIDLQFGVTNKKYTMLEEEIKSLQAEVAKHKAALNQSKSTAQVMELSAQFENVKTAHHFLADELKDNLYEQRRLVKKTTTQVADFLTEWLEDSKNRTDPRSSALESRLSVLTNAILGAVSSISEQTSCTPQHIRIPEELTPEREDIQDLLQQRLDDFTALKEEDGTFVTKEDLAEKIRTDFEAISLKGALKQLNDESVGHFKAGEDLLLACGKVKALRSLKEKAESDRHAAEVQVQEISVACATLKEKVETLTADLSQGHTVSEGSIEATLTSVAEYLDDRTASGTQKAAVPNEIHQRLHDLSHEYSLITEQKRQLEAQSRELLEHTWSYFNPQERMIGGGGGGGSGRPVVDTKSGPDECYNQSTQDAAAGLVQMLEGDAKRLNRMNTKLKQIRQQEASKWSAIISSASTVDPPAPGNTGIGNGLFAPPKREGNGAGVLNALKKFLEESKEKGDTEEGPIEAEESSPVMSPLKVGFGKVLTKPTLKTSAISTPLMPVIKRPPSPALTLLAKQKLAALNQSAPPVPSSIPPLEKPPTPPILNAPVSPDLGNLMEQKREGTPPLMNRIRKLKNRK